MLFRSLSMKYRIFRFKVFRCIIVEDSVENSKGNKFMRPFAPITDIDVALNISIILLITIMLFCCVILIISYFEVFRLSIIDKWFFTFIPIFASSMFMIILDWYIAFPLSFLYTYIMYIGAKNYLEKDQIIELEGANSRFRKRRSDRKSVV